MYWGSQWKLNGQENSVNIKSLDVVLTCQKNLENYQLKLSD